MFCLVALSTLAQKKLGFIRNGMSAINVAVKLKLLQPSERLAKQIYRKQLRIIGNGEFLSASFFVKLLNLSFCRLVVDDIFEH